MRWNRFRIIPSPSHLLLFNILMLVFGRIQSEFFYVKKKQHQCVYANTWLFQRHFCTWDSICCIESLYRRLLLPPHFSFPNEIRHLQAIATVMLSCRISNIPNCKLLTACHPLSNCFEFHFVRGNSNKVEKFELQL